MSEFIKIAITPPDFTISDVAKAVAILQLNEADILHLRIPQASESQMKRIIDAIPGIFYDRIKLHSHFSIIKESGLRGAHLNKRNPYPPRFACKLSMSCHTLAEVGDAPSDMEYVTLSPIFDSISKEGYGGNDKLSEGPLPDNVPVIALGGVTPDKFEILKKKGFEGAAMLGYFFNR